MSISATVVKAANPKAMKSCVPMTRYLVLSINIDSGYFDSFETGDLAVAKRHFSERGDPAMWRGLQILRVDVNGGAR